MLGSDPDTIPARFRVFRGLLRIRSDSTGAVDVRDRKILRRHCCFV